MNIYFLSAIILAVIVVIILFWLIITLHKRVSAFTRGSNGTSLENVMRNLLKDHDAYMEKHSDLVKVVENINQRVITSHRGFAMIRYNAFEHTGGNQSFCCGLLDENGEGMLLSSLYSRERSNSFAKPIHNFKCEFELTKEEQEVLKQTIKSLDLKK